MSHVPDLPDNMKVFLGLWKYNLDNKTLQQVIGISHNQLLFGTGWRDLNYMDNERFGSDPTTPFCEWETVSEVQASALLDKEN